MKITEEEKKEGWISVTLTLKRVKKYTKEEAISALKRPYFEIEDYEIKDWSHGKTILYFKFRPIFLGKKIQIKNCNAVGGAFANITHNSTHEIIKPPNNYDNYSNGVWVMGSGEPVKILNREFVFLNKTNCDI